MKQLFNLGLEAADRTRESLPRLLALQARVQAGETMDARDIGFLIDAIEAAHASIALGETNSLAARVIELSEAISMRLLLNDQRGESTRYRNHSTNHERR